tara:strand:+ start:6982 stop:7968 length:987 start_codon:yes stop_codon:yes gene_type:complete
MTSRQLRKIKNLNISRYNMGGYKSKYNVGGVRKKFANGGSVYNDNTVQNAGQGNVQSTASTVFQESNSELQAQRLKSLDDITKQSIEDASLTASKVDALQAEGEVKADFEAEKALLESKSKSDAIMNMAGKGATLAQKSGAFTPAATTTAATTTGGATAGTFGGAGVGTGIGKFASSGVGLGLAANLAGAGISKWSDDDDPTKSNFGEYSGAVLSGAGTGASYGSMFGPAGTLIGGVAGGIYGGLSQMWGTKEAKEAEEEAEKEFEEKKTKAIKKYNTNFIKNYGTQLSASNAGRIANKTYSGYDLGQNVVARMGGMRMGTPRYGYKG